MRKIAATVMMLIGAMVVPAVAQQKYSCAQQFKG